MFVTYILRSKKTKRYYYGHTTDLDKRLGEHNKARVRSTKHGIPWEVIYTEQFETKSEAYKRELFFKSIEGYRFLKENNIT